MKILICRVPVVDGAAQEGPMTYFQKYTSTGTPFFVKDEKDAKTFDDYQDPELTALTERLNVMRGWDWAYLEKVDEQAA
jgi:hypothetical protein